MKNCLQRLGIGLLCLGLTLSLIPPGVIDAAPPAQTQLAASLEVLAPGVEIQRAGTEQWLPATGRSVVAAGDRIRTDESGEAIVVWFDDGSLMNLKPDTEIEINAFEGSATDDDATFTIETTVTVGRVFHGVERLIDAESRYQVNTPTMAAAVRGTVFGLEVNAEEEALMLVTEGTVNATQDDSQQTVEAGFWIRATPGEPLSEPVTIESVLDNPFIQAFVDQFDDFEDLRQDSDGDGVFDVNDECPDVPGEASRDGCPRPGGDDNDADTDDTSTRDDSPSRTDDDNDTDDVDANRPSRDDNDDDGDGDNGDDDRGEED